METLNIVLAPLATLAWIVLILAIVRERFFLGKQ